MKKICILTATRAEFGLFKPILSAIDRSDKLESLLIVTGTHLSAKFGSTINEIESSGCQVDEIIDSAVFGNKPEDMALNVAAIIMGMTDIIVKHSPDLCFLLGDRGEQLAVAIAASYLNIPIAHSHGGDRSGTIDENVRHAITKLSHIHFPACQDSADRLHKLGEESWRIHLVGAPGIDNILNAPIPELKELDELYNINLVNRNFALLLFHPNPYEAKDASSQLSEILMALNYSNLKIVTIYPNSDAGGKEIIEVLKTQDKQRFIGFKSLPSNHYLGFLKHCSFLIGNSSSGIIESPSFGIPTINVGNRQQGRQRAENVIDVGFDFRIIADQIQLILNGKMNGKVIRSPYGEGKAGEKIVHLLTHLPLDQKLLQKKMTY